ncbi:MAG: 4Fe-4S dicluster domain-containing protein [Acidobacteriia bacterium]|nr:4Fe-4S dicluster domain-containing protein [Terriglobia bacterium]
MANEPRGKVTIDIQECKGCGLCVDACPPKCLELAPELTTYGVHPGRYLGSGCTGCGICFYACPEPGAITVYRMMPPPKSATTLSQEANRAATL